MKRIGRHLPAWLSIAGLALTYPLWPMSVAGQVLVWGDNSFGQTNVPPQATNLLGLAGGDYHLVGVRRDGTVVAWGANSSGQTNVPTAATNAVAVAAGSTHSLALRADGSVVLWGRFYGSGLSTVPEEATNLVALATGPGAQHALALRRDGGLVAWGHSSSDAGLLTNFPPAAANVVDIAMGAHHSVALRADGRVVAWGRNDRGQINVPASATNIVAIAAGWYYNLALRADGTVLTWGASASAPPPSAGFTNVVDVACPFNSSFGAAAYLAARLDGTLARWQGVAAPSSTAPFVAVAAMSSGAMALFGNGPPAFRTIPINRRAVAGANVHFRAPVVGALPMSYQWTRDGADIPGATGPVLTLTNVQPEQSATLYSLVVSNALGTVRSASMRLDVLPVEILSPPRSGSVVAGSNVTFQVSALGPGPLSYQWQFNGADIDGATDSTLTLTSVQLSDAGAYSVTVASTLGTVTSPEARLSVLPLLITTHPKDQSVLAGTNVDFAISVVGISPMTFQWQFEGADLLGETNVSLTLSLVSPSQGGAYRVIVSNAHAVVASSNALLTVRPLSIVTQPQNVSVWQGATAAVEVSAAGAGPFAYQWLFNGSTLEGATGNPLILSPAHPTLAGLYSVIVSNTYGSVTSDPARLTVSQVAAWGSDSDHQVTLPVGLTNLVALAAGYYHNLALRGDGTIILWGFTNSQSVPPGLSNVIGVAAGGFHSLALKSNGTVAAWGDGFYDSTAVPADLTNVVAVSAGEYHSTALLSDGTVQSWGAGTTNTGTWPHLGQSRVPEGLSNVVAISAGGTHNLALRADGTLVGWGNRTEAPADATNLIAIAAGYNHDVALRNDGTVLAWGDNLYGQPNLPPGLNHVVAIASGNWCSAALTADGRIVAWGRNEYGETTVPTLNVPVVAIAVGNFHMAVVLDDHPRLLRASQSEPRWADNHFATAISTQSGSVYALEYRRGWEGDWTILPLVPGTGGSVTLNDGFATNQFRMYRVRRW